MITYLKDPPKFVTNIGAWEYTLAKLATLQEQDGKPRTDEGGNPLNYGQAVAIYKAVCKKYPAFRTNNAATAPYKVGQVRDEQKLVTLDALCDAYPVGQMFWYDDVLCEAVRLRGRRGRLPGRRGQAVHPWSGARRGPARPTQGLAGRQGQRLPAPPLRRLDGGVI